MLSFIKALFCKKQPAPVVIGVQYGYMESSLRNRLAIRAKEVVKAMQALQQAKAELAKKNDGFSKAWVGICERRVQSWRDLMNQSRKELAAYKQHTAKPIYA